MGTVAVMYSGGLDSLIAYHVALSRNLTPLCIHVPLGVPYGYEERYAIDTVKSLPGGPEKVLVLGDLDLYYAISHRLKNQILPSRNVLLAVIGSMFSPLVWINSLEGEQNGKEHDKSERFFADVSALLTYTNAFFQDVTTVDSPLKDKTKAEAIAWALDAGVPLQTLFATRSCYSGTRDKCGECLTCVKRYLAFKELGIEEPGYHQDPLRSDYFFELLDSIPGALARNDRSRFTDRRLAGMFKALAQILREKK